ncbi:MAG: preprotein translocase subunit SecE [Acidobacteriota bacterium]|nr:preprotein translocase subunit SecE [Acidobacteriota bacterium]
MKERLQRLNRFLTDVRGEVQRTTFPSGKEVQGTTIVVIVTSMIFATFLFVVDFGLRKAIDYLFEVFVR